MSMLEEFSKSVKSVVDRAFLGGRCYEEINDYSKCIGELK